MSRHKWDPLTKVACASELAAVNRRSWKGAGLRARPPGPAAKRFVLGSWASGYLRIAQLLSLANLWVGYSAGTGFVAVASFRLPSVSPPQTGDRLAGAYLLAVDVRESASDVPD